MLQIIIRKTVQFYNSKNRWWLPLVCGILFSLCLPPFNHEFHPLFSLFPFLNFVVLIPLLGFASQKSFRRAAFHTYLFSFAASLSQYYWIAFDKAEGLWQDRKSTRLNFSHVRISYAVFCLKKKSWGGAYGTMSWTDPEEKL